MGGRDRKSIRCSGWRYQWSRVINKNFMNETGVKLSLEPRIRQGKGRIFLKEENCVYKYRGRNVQGLLARVKNESEVRHQ
jgi:hypothetical protein